MMDDLDSAIAAANATAHLRTTSTSALADRVTTSPEYRPGVSQTLAAIPGLDGCNDIRAIDVLHELARITSPGYDDALFDVYLQWALFRYLGVFQLDPCIRGHKSSRLAPTNSCTNVVGNQRRILSEDLGIGFGAAIGRLWMRQLFPGVPISIIDIDVALSRKGKLIQGERIRVQRSGPSRPDYVLAATLAPGDVALRGLECKGTKSTSNSRTQMAKAARQLSGLHLKGSDQAVPGIAVGSVVDKSIQVFALGPAVDARDAPGVSVDTATILRSAAVDLDKTQDVPDGPELAAASLRSSWAAMADFAGDSETARLWAPSALRDKLPHREYRSERADTRFGVATGRYLSIQSPSGRITVRFLLDETIGETIRRYARQPSDPEVVGAIASAQRSFASRVVNVLPEAGEAEYHVSTTGEGTVSSTFSDGTTLMIEFERF